MTSTPSSSTLPQASLTSSHHPSSRILKEQDHRERVPKPVEKLSVAAPVHPAVRGRLREVGGTGLKY